MRPALLQQLALSAAILAATQCSGPKAADPAARDNDAAGAFESELARIDHQLSELRAGGASLDTESKPSTQQVYLLYLRAVQTTAPADVEAVRAAITAGLAAAGHSEDLYLIRAQLDLKFHRLDRADESLRMLPHRAGTPLVVGLRADLALQRGQLDAAERLAEKAQALSPSWDNLARLAHLRYQQGDVEGAESLYSTAQNEITAKEMRAYAWVELQRGLLDFRSGRASQALTHYRHAERAYGGWWLIDEHIAEALAATGKHHQAVELYETVIARTLKPELMHALGNVLRDMGESGRAREWHDKALSGYLASTRRGGVHYLHHLADYYGEVERDGPSAVKWAREDFRLRPSADSQARLAWFLFQDGQLSEARSLMIEALDRSSSQELLARSEEILGGR